MRLTNYYRDDSGWYELHATDRTTKIDLKTISEKHRNALMLIDASGVYNTEKVGGKSLQTETQRLANALHQKGFRVYIYCTTKKVSITEEETK